MKGAFLLCFWPLLFISCSHQRNVNTESLHWANRLVKPLLFYNDSVLSYQLKPEYRKLSVPFSDNEKGFVPQGEKYNYSLISIDGRYYTVAEYKDKNGFTYKLIVYSVIGDNDTEILVTQINSYQQESLIDALILELNFTFETQISSHYSVNDSLATVDRYEINDILYADESGDIIGTKAKPDTVIYRSIYKIADGRFVKKMEKRIK